MKRVRLAGAAIGLGLVLLLGGAAQAAPDADRASSKDRARLTDVSAQQQVRHRRPPTRIRVAPVRRPYRQCVDWYALERRPSGDVITPQQHCWWTTR